MPACPIWWYNVYLLFFCFMCFFVPCICLLACVLAVWVPARLVATADDSFGDILRDLFGGIASAGVGGGGVLNDVVDFLEKRVRRFVVVVVVTRLASAPTFLTVALTSLIALSGSTIGVRYSQKHAPPRRCCRGGTDGTVTISYIHA